MTDAMVTARMTQEKKDAGNRVFEQLGTNASQVVNRLYDYAISEGALPFPDRDARSVTQKDIARAAEWLDGVQTLPAGNRFSTMTDREIKLERLESLGLMDNPDVS